MTSPSKLPPQVRIFDSADLAGRTVAEEVATDVSQWCSEGRSPVLGLPTGATPEAIYRHWCRLHLDHGFDWSSVVTFNLDEYWPLPKSSEHSYHRFMNEKLFVEAGFDPRHTYIPSGMVAQTEIDEHCQRYEAAIQKHGGIDVQLLGIGINGHIGFNEPGSDPTSPTRLVELAESTRKRAQPGFGDTEVPTYGITMGLGTILKSRRIYLMAFGSAKAEAVRDALLGPVTSDCPGSYLQNHADVEWVLDTDAAALLG